MSSRILDPAIFLDSAIDSETLALNEEIISSLSGLPPLKDTPIGVLRDTRLTGSSPFPLRQLCDKAIERSIPGPCGEIGLRIIAPANPKAIYLHFHGGGWIMGTPEQSDATLEYYADNMGLACVSVDYRLAPENPFPAGAEDCEAAALWLIENAKAEFGTEIFSVGGESAGAHLSALTLLRLRDKHGYRDFRAANLVFGVFDLGLTPSAANWGSERLIVDTPNIRWVTECFVPDASRRRDPDISPLFADLNGHATGTVYGRHQVSSARR